MEIAHFLIRNSVVFVKFKLNKNIILMIRLIYALCFLMSTIILLSSCDGDDSQIIDNSTVSVSTEITVNGVKIKVLNSQLKIGDDLVIEGSETNSSEVSMSIQCESLNINEELKTPFVFKKKMEIEGSHSIAIKSNGYTSTIKINVIK